MALSATDLLSGGLARDADYRLLVTGGASGGFAVTGPLDADGNVKVGVATNLIPRDYDYISLGYTGSNLTSAVYKQGGAGGATVATLTLAYSGSNLSSVTRT